jgi:patatin-like phospholipase/acyl hydrolase
MAKSTQQRGGAPGSAPANGAETLLARSSEAGARFLVLAVDGGGARGYLAARILERVEAYLDLVTGEPAPLGARFDLVAGTSTGGIIALGLALGLSARDVASLYEQHVPRIFAPAMRRSLIAGQFRPLYRTDALRAALRDFFGDRTLADTRTDVCVTAVSLVNAHPRVFRSDYAGSGLLSGDEKLLDIALATSAAPAVFPAHSTRHLCDLIDGGLCASSPVLVALAEAFSFERESRRGAAPPQDLGGQCLDRLAVLSVGTGEQCAMPYTLASLRRAGLLAWGAHFHQVSMAAQGHLVHSLAKRLLRDAYWRINPRLEFPMRLDDPRRMAELKSLAQLSDEDLQFLRTRVAGTAPLSSPSAPTDTAVIPSPHGRDERRDALKAAEPFDAALLTKATP